MCVDAAGWDLPGGCGQQMSVLLGNGLRVALQAAWTRRKEARIFPIADALRAKAALVLHRQRRR